MVFGGPDELTNHESILGDGSPCHARRLPWLDSGKSLVFSEERSQVEKTISKFGLGSEVGRGCWNDAGICRIRSRKLFEIDFWSGDGGWC